MCSSTPNLTWFRPRVVYLAVSGGISSTLIYFEGKSYPPLVYCCRTVVRDGIKLGQIKFQFI